MKKLIFTVLFLFSCSFSYSQWVSNFGDTGGDLNFSSAKGNAIATDANGYSYVTGYTYEMGSANDIVIIKYTPTGDTAWARSYNGDANQNDEGMGICVDNSGNVYVIGTAQYTGKSYDVVLLKYSPQGTQLWAKTYRGTEDAKDDKGLAIAVDASGYIYTTGFTTGILGTTSIFTRKSDPSGNEMWTKAYSGNGIFGSQGLGIAVSNSGNVYVTGYVSTLLSNTNITVLKYDNSGTFKWNRDINGSGNQEDKAWGIVVDDNDNVYITGYITASYNNTDCYTAKLNTNGDIAWSKTFGGGQTDKAWGIVVDTDGSVYITGETTMYSSNSNYVTIKYTSNGYEAWAVSYDGTGHGDDAASSIGILRGTGNIVVTGKSWGTDNNYDYATVKYSTNNGYQNSVSRYTFSGNSDDIAKAVSVTVTNKVVITGISQLLVESSAATSYISTVSLDYTSELTSTPVVPQSYSLYQNYPNPFNPSTNIRFDLKKASMVKLTVYDMLGSEVGVLVNQQLGEGEHNISFNAGNLSSGVYFYKLEAGSFHDIKKMTLIK